jgi:hypothetical protein
LQKIEGIDFEEAWQNRLETEIDTDVPTHVISLNDLIRNKLAVARPQDILDVEKIREAERARDSAKKPGKS